MFAGINQHAAAGLCRLVSACVLAVGANVAGASPPVVAIGGEGRGLTVTDARTRTMSGPLILAAPAYALWIEPAGKRAFVVSPFEQPGFPDNYGPGRLYVVDIEQLRIEHTIPLLADGFSIGALPSGKALYVTHVAGGVISRIDTSTYEVEGFAFTGADAITVAPDGQRVYIASYPEIVVARATDLSVLERFNISSAVFDMAVTPDGSRLVLVAWGGLEQVKWWFKVLSLETGELTLDIELDQYFNRLVVDAGGRYAYLSGGPSVVARVDLTADGAVTKLPIGAATGAAALTPDGRELWFCMRTAN